MLRIRYLLAVLLLLVPLLTLGCNAGEEPTDPQQPVEEPADSDETLKPDPVDENGQPWLEANQLDQEKTTTIMMEGMEESISLSLQVSSQFPYAIYLDGERYRLDVEGGRDIILPRDEVADLPEVLMSIQHKQDVSISQFASELADQLGAEYDHVNEEGWVYNPVQAVHIYAVNNGAHDDTVERYYLVEDFADGIFVIRQQLFVEALEGHGNRFDRMLEEFYIWHFEKCEYLLPS